MPKTERVTLHMHAPPEKIYGLVSDISRMGEWSPECYRTEWLGSDREARPGARFKGHNRYGPVRWSTTAEIEVAEPGRELTFVTIIGGKKRTRWTYRFAAADSGTDVEESHEDVVPYPAPARLLMKAITPGHDGKLGDNMRRTLERLKTAAEKG
jgi:uncharacterized protein YndB with AHSA1/START domain